MQKSMALSIKAEPKVKTKKGLDFQLGLTVADQASPTGHHRLLMRIRPGHALVDGIHYFAYHVSTSFPDETRGSQRNRRDSFTVPRFIVSGRRKAAERLLMRRENVPGVSSLALYAKKYLTVLTTRRSISRESRLAAKLL
jgi:hypothetical protein